MKYKSTQIMKQIYLILTGIFLMLFISCARHTKENKDCQTVKIDTVIAADKQKFLQFPGRVKAAQDISLSFRVSGTINKIYVKDGAQVREGRSWPNWIRLTIRYNWTLRKLNTVR